MPAFIWKNNVTGSCNMARVEKLQVVPDLLRGDENNSRIKFDDAHQRCGVRVLAHFGMFDKHF